MTRVRSKASGLRPGLIWRIVRTLCLCAAPLAILVAPILGGWQRMDRNYLAAWDGHGWDIPTWLLAHLPMGDAPKLAHESNLLLGGGSGLEYLGMSMMDPVSGGIALAAEPTSSWLVWVAWSVPVLLALVLGRVFCGWFCPFGSLARASESLVDRLPFRVPRYTLPDRRWLRYLILALGGLAGATLGSGIIYWFLPYVLLQNSIYSMWLMGGGGASLGALCGLLLAGMVFGPTTYCATLCPTGGALALLGRHKAVHLTIMQPTDCGAKCDLCDHACWLSLRPSTGEPGPDCDMCGRCADICPKDNLGISRHPRPRSRVPAVMAALLLAVGGMGTLGAGEAHAAVESPDDPPWMRPRTKLVFEERQQVGKDGDVDVWMSVKDLNGVRPEVDSLEGNIGIEVSVYIARGEPGAVSPRGKQSPREEVYVGPLTILVQPSAGAEPITLAFARPTDPISTPNRSIYRRHMDVSLEPGARVTIPPLPGWFETETSVEVTRDNNELPLGNWALQASGAFVLFSGLLLLALAGARPLEKSAG